jgi:hypothetical protein
MSQMKELSKTAGFFFADEKNKTNQKPKRATKKKKQKGFFFVLNFCFYEGKNLKKIPNLKIFSRPRIRVYFYARIRMGEEKKTLI